MAAEEWVHKFKKDRITMAWLLCITGILFCLAGVYQFKKNAFEEDKAIRPSVVIMIMGVILIAVGTAKYFDLIR